MFSRFAFVAALVALLGHGAVAALADPPVTHTEPPDRPHFGPGPKPTVGPPVGIVTVTITPADSSKHPNGNTLFRNEKFSVNVSGRSVPPAAFQVYNTPDSAQCTYDVIVTNKNTGEAGPSVLGLHEIDDPIAFPGLATGNWNITVGPSSATTPGIRKCEGSIVLPVHVTDQSVPVAPVTPSPSPGP